MPRFFPAALFFVAIIVYFKPAESIKCYVCRSDNNKDCEEEDLSKSLIQECPKRPNAYGEYCRKVRQQLIFKKEESITTIRECAYEKNPRQCYRLKWTSTAYQETCECDEDLCNTSTHCAESGTFTLAMLIVLTFYTYLYFR